MAAQPDYKKEWEKTKKHLISFSKEAAKIAKKGEEELVRLSKKGKLQFDSTAINLKKDHLYKKIGKEYVKSGCSNTQTAKLKKLIDELTKIQKEQTKIKNKIKKIK